MRSASARFGLTLIELIVVLAILIGLAGLIVPMLSGRADDARKTATNASLVQLRDVILGTYRLDMGNALPLPGAYGQSQGRPAGPQLRYLFVNPTTESAGNPASTTNTFNPVTKLGWRGPYLMAGTGTYTINAAQGFTNQYGLSNDPTVLDGWLNPIVVLTVPNANGTTTYTLCSAGPDGKLNTTDDLVLPLLTQ